MQGDPSPEAGEVRIVGGKGKWQDATDTGTIRPLGEERRAREGVPGS